MQYILQKEEYDQLIDKRKVKKPLLKLCDTLLKEIAVSNQLGDSITVTFQRKTLTDAISAFQSELEL